MTNKAEDIFAFQELFMETLFSCDEPEEIKQLLLNNTNCPQLTAWIKNLSPHMLEVAARMTQFWGRKKA